MTPAKVDFYTHYITPRNRRLMVLFVIACNALLFLEPLFFYLRLPTSRLALFPPLSLSFFALLVLMDREKPFDIKLRVKPCILMLVALEAMFIRPNSYITSFFELFTLTGVVVIITGVFCFIDFDDFIQRAQVMPRPVLIALTGGTSLIAYSFLRLYIWERVCNSTGLMVYYLLQLMRFDVSFFTTPFYSIHRHTWTGVANVGTPEFALRIHESCSGMEGIFLFFFMLSLVLLADWKLFARLRCLNLYLIVVLYMFTVNVLRIVSVYLAAIWLQANVHTLAVQYQARAIFHSNVGLVVYLAAFSVFIVALYSYATKQAKQAG